MEWLNYHHLYYFWLVAREGSIARAAAQMRLTHPTVSKQLSQLESFFEDKLFERLGRNLVLTEFGHAVFRYADEIFSVGRELQEAVHRGSGGRPLSLRVGLVEVLPKLVAHRLLNPAFQRREPVHVICREGKFEDLLAELAVHRLDIVLSDAPVGVLSDAPVGRTSARAEVTASGAGRLCDEENFVRSAALECIKVPSGAGKTDIPAEKGERR